MTKSRLFKELDVEIIGGKELTPEDSKLISSFIKEHKVKRQRRAKRASKDVKKPLIG